MPLAAVLMFSLMHFVALDQSDATRRGTGAEWSPLTIAIARQVRDLGPLPPELVGMEPVVRQVLGA